MFRYTGIYLLTVSMCAVLAVSTGCGDDPPTGLVLRTRPILDTSLPPIPDADLAVPNPPTGPPPDTGANDAGSDLLSDTLGPDVEDLPDTTLTDVAPDTAQQDTLAEDTAQQDTLAEDTAQQDTLAQDTTVQDTTVQDTTVQDTTVQDTNVVDTIVADTQQDPDIPMCDPPRPQACNALDDNCDNVTDDLLAHTGRFFAITGANRVTDADSVVFGRALFIATQFAELLDNGERRLRGTIAKLTYPAPSGNEPFPTLSESAAFNCAGAPRIARSASRVAAMCEPTIEGNNRSARMFVFQQDLQFVTSLALPRPMVFQYPHLLLRDLPAADGLQQMEGYVAYSTAESINGDDLPSVILEYYQLCITGGCPDVEPSPQETYTFDAAFGASLAFTSSRVAMLSVQAVFDDSGEISDLVASVDWFRISNSGPTFEPASTVSVSLQGDIQCDPDEFRTEVMRSERTQVTGLVEITCADTDASTFIVVQATDPSGDGPATMRRLMGAVGENAHIAAEPFRGDADTAIYAETGSFENEPTDPDGPVFAHIGGSDPFFVDFLRAGFAFLPPLELAVTPRNYAIIGATRTTADGGGLFLSPVTCDWVP